MTRFDGNTLAKPRMKGRPKPPLSKLSARALSFVLKKPASVMFSATSAGLGAAILLNALVFQTRQHPAPFFGEPRVFGEPRARIQPSAPLDPSEKINQRSSEKSLTSAGTGQQLAALPPSRPTDLTGLIADVNRKPLQAAKQSASPAPATHVEPDYVNANQTKPIPPKDLIGQLIQNVSVNDEPRERVASVQRALFKIGFLHIKADGIAGQETRKAIELFQKEQKLPITGEISARVVRELSSVSGIAID